MMRYLRNAGLFLGALFMTVSVRGQDRTVWRAASDVIEGVSGSIVGTVAGVDDGNNQLQVQSDDDRYGQIAVDTDAVSTQYNGFGDTIGGKPEIFIGTKGFSNVREGDRIEIRGVGRAAGVIRADQVTLLVRSVAAPETGVGDTRSPSNISTPTVGSTATVYGRIEGVVREVDAADNRIVVETDRREIFNIIASSGTPVTYNGQVYRVINLEPGDRIRVESDGSGTTDREIRARSITVVKSVQDSGTGARVSSISGHVTRIDRTADVIRIDTGRGETRVDMSRAYDSTGRRVRAADTQMGDLVEISGSSGAKSDLFSAVTVRFSDDATPSSGGDAQLPPPPAGDTEYPPDLVTVTVSGTITETLQNAATLSIRDRATGRVIPLYVTEDFAVKTKAGAYTTADKLNVNDNVIVKAYRDSDGDYIAQTIRMR